MASVCKRHRLGSTNGPRESKVEWTNDGPFGTPSPTLRCRDSLYVAYAELCGPDDILDALWGDVQNCAGVAAGAATLATIFASPGAATAAFETAFKGCLATKIADRVNEIQVHLGVSNETGDWGAC
jgi:hypothetical protein